MTDVSSNPRPVLIGKTAPPACNRKLTACIAIGIVCLTGVVRWLASWDDFWLDEIWSWSFAIRATSYWQIATAFPHDNNQILNTWIIYSFPRNAHWTTYRLPAVIAGIGTVVLAGLCGFRRNKTEGMIALILTGTSFVFIQYSSEARGYAYLLFFTFLCLWLMQRITGRPTVRDQLLFSVSASLGFLSHFLFASAFAGFFVWTVVCFSKCYPRWGARLLAIGRMYALPILIVGGVISSYRAQLMSGGGERHQVLSVIVETASLAIGGPNAGLLAVICSVIAITALIAGTVMMVRERDGRFLFVVTSIATLTLLIMISGSDTVYVRHLLVPMAATLVVFSHLLARCWLSGTVSRYVCCLCVLAIVAGNAMHTYRLLEYGRGGYGQALAFMRAESKQSDLSIGSDHDFRNGFVLSYHYLWLNNPKPLHYYNLGQWPPEGPEWIIRHVLEPEKEPVQKIQDGRQHSYQLVAIYPHSGLSGWTWMIYHRVPNEAS